MAGTESPNEAKIVDNPEGNLPDVLASLEMLTVTSTPSEPVQPAPRRVLRKRIPKSDKTTEVRNRRCSMRPQKRSADEMESDEDVKTYYLDRNVRQKPNNLETIYEEDDKTENASAIAISSRKFKRLIQFEIKASDAKIRKRRAKIKRAFGSKLKLKHGFLSMQTVINKLNTIRTDSPSKINHDQRFQTFKVV